MTESSGRPERPVRVLADVELVSLTLDPAAVPYEDTPASSMANDRPYIPEISPALLDGPGGFPSRVRCPDCDHVTELPDGGSDDELELFWDHLAEHTTHPLARLELWVTAMAGAR